MSRVLLWTGSHWLSPGLAPAACHARPAGFALTIKTVSLGNTEEQKGTCAPKTAKPFYMRTYPIAKWVLVTTASQHQDGGEHLLGWVHRRNSNWCLSTGRLCVLVQAVCCRGGLVWLLLLIAFAGCSSPMISLIVALKILFST